MSVNRLAWMRHRVVGHWASAILRKLGMRRIAFWLHDATLPEYQSHTWDMIGHQAIFDEQKKR